MKGLIFSIKRYSVHDGPGIRVTFFMKGCPLACCWCHNPEGISPEPETAGISEKVGDREFIVSRQAGEYYSAGEIIDVLDRDKIFITRSDGGVTFSGGEPMFQPEFLLEALEMCKASGYHTAIDTSGYSQPVNFKSVMPHTDLFLFDVKHLDPALHFHYTGVSNELILGNLKMILGSGKDVMIRVPVIPGINDDHEHMEQLKILLVDLKCENLKKICLLPYHRIGVSKYRRFRIQDRMSDIAPPSAARMKDLKDYFESTGIRIKIGG